ncbi:MAG: type II toxin-antitoxin system HicA family toxin [Cyanobacteria bacterium]|nr:type II toxin-antitoxin system HicA family toxin [Cyanobacteriota bacterium]
MPWIDTCEAARLRSIVARTEIVQLRHRQFKHPVKPGRVTISGHLGDDMPKGTFASVKRQAGWKGPTL